MRAPAETPRPMILYVKQLMDDAPLVGVEIGVHQGANAQSILQTLNVECLYLVDPYLPFICAGQWLDPRPAKTIAIERLSKFQDRIRFLFLASEAAVSEIPNELDFVYIDGNHDYEYVRRDIQLYYPKVRVGGVLGGHDYGAAYPGVVKAAHEMNEKVLVKYWDWWIVKCHSS